MGSIYPESAVDKTMATVAPFRRFFRNVTESCLRDLPPPKRGL